MATATLVTHDIEIGRRIVTALAKARIPVTVCLWGFERGADTWQFWVATPLVDTKGPLAAYRLVNKALQKDNVLKDAPRGGIFLKSPSDPVLKSLEKQSKAVPQESFRTVNERVSTSFIEEAYVYGGLIITESENIPSGNTASTYYLTYTSHSGSEEATFRVTGADNLRNTLLSGLRVRRELVDSAVHELGLTKTTAIPNIKLTLRDLRRLKPV